MRRFKPWMAGLGSAAFALYAAQAYATSFEPQAMGVKLEFWLSAGLSIGLAIISGYMRALGKRISMIEYDNRQLQSQISGVREMIKGEYYPKAEIGAQLDDLKDTMVSLHRRMDYFAGGQSGRNFPGEG